MKKILFILLVITFCLLFFSFKANTQAAADYTNQTYSDWSEAKKCAKTGTCGEAYSQWSMNSSLFSLSSGTFGDPPKPGEPLKVYRENFKKSALGMLVNFTGALYDHPPASFSYFAYDVLQNAGFVPKAYAQGIGFSGLGPIFPIWKTFRNISYMFILVILIVVGFMIMFRAKINPQTVISIQNALPNLIVTLLLITFSYAIAGLLIDLMYFAMRLVINIIVSSGITGYEANPERVAYLEQFYLNANVGDLFKTIFSKESLFAVPESIFNTFWRGWIENAQNSDRGRFLHIADVITGTVFSVVSIIPGAIGTILIALALLFSFVRIFFILLNSYIQIILAVILAPFQLLFGAIPGKDAFKGWFLGIVGNLAVFPATVFIFLLGAGIANVSFDPNRGKIWVAPFIAGPSSDADLITGLIGLGLIILTPSLLNAVKGAFQAKPVLPISPGVIVQPLLGGGQTVLSTAMQISYLKGAGSMLPGKIGEYFRKK